jgi:catechol 2,3-dioxygenase-like lactoylglutathione lyase family enzyme
MEVLSSRVIVATVDFDRSRSFYEDVLGLRVYREYGSGDAITGVVFFLGGGFLEVTSGAGASPGDAVKLWLQVPDLEAEERRLRQAGARVRKPAGRMPWGLLELWIEDPDGLEVRLIEVPPEHPLRRRLD